MKTKFKVNGSAVVAMQSFPDDYVFWAVLDNEVELTNEDTRNAPLETLIYENGEVKVNENYAPPAVVLPYDDKACKQELLSVFPYAWVKANAGLWGMLSDCLAYQNWGALMIVGGNAINANDATEEQFALFCSIVKKHNGLPD